MFCLCIFVSKATGFRQPIIPCCAFRVYFVTSFTSVSPFSNAAAFSSVMRRRATLPHPVGCSTIAVPGLSFRVRNGTGRLTWAMAAANLLLYGQTLGSAGLWRPGNRIGDADVSMFRLVARQCSLPSGAVCRRKMRSNRQGLEC